MNIVDYIILGLVGISLLYGMYRGFISSVFSLVGVFIAMYVAYALCPLLTDYIRGNETLIQTLAYYTDASARVGDLDLALSPVAGLDSAVLADIVQRTNLPAPFDTLFQFNLTHQVFQALGSINVSEYLNQTILSVALNILCYLVVFAVAYAALTLLFHLIGYVFRVPVLKQFDVLLGGAFGIARGVFFVYLLFTLVPILMTIMPMPQMQTLVDQSQFGQMLYHSNIIQTIIQGHL